MRIFEKRIRISRDKNLTSSEIIGSCLNFISQIFWNFVKIKFFVEQKCLVPWQRLKNNEVLRVFEFCIRNERAADDSHVHTAFRMHEKFANLKATRFTRTLLVSDSPIFYNLNVFS